MMKEIKIYSGGRVKRLSELDTKIIAVLAAYHLKTGCDYIDVGHIMDELLPSFGPGRTFMAVRVSTGTRILDHIDKLVKDGIIERDSTNKMRFLRLIPEKTIQC